MSHFKEIFTFQGDLRPALKRPLSLNRPLQYYMPGITLTKLTDKYYMPGITLKVTDKYCQLAHH